MPDKFAQFYPFKYEIDYRLSNSLFSYQYARLRKYSFS